METGHEIGEKLVMLKPIGTIGNQHHVAVWLPFVIRLVVTAGFVSASFKVNLVCFAELTEKVACSLQSVVGILAEGEVTH